MSLSFSVVMAAVVLSCYLAVYVFHYGLPESISETYYHIGKRWVFCSVLAAVAVLLLVPWIEGGRHEWCAFLSCAAVLFVSASPQFRDEYVGKIHYGAAAVMGICSLAWLILNGAPLYLLFLCIGAALADRKRWVWWLEVGLFSSVVNALV
ncbi:MAG: hypothetical protein IJS04_03780 [Muribaculaceae bacterium]|nr:hypothetical protein [Muribaculaceae bacterium]